MHPLYGEKRQDWARTKMFLDVRSVQLSISSRGNHATNTQYLVKDIPPASRGVIHAVCRFLKSRSNKGG